MKLYVVTQEGVYRHGIRGIFRDEQAASDCAKACAADPEDDGYHEYDIGSCESGEAIEDLDPIGSWKKPSTGKFPKTPNNNEPVYTDRRVKS